ncbi:MAG TPA: nickel-dependent hydrogenase large subunit [Candidatus Limnocylindrales bacterium]|nr:nickel-dependent hydrogenase large subunit [Candidatus Limnocylindrales bacterium]
MTRLVIDPVTRVGGQLRIEVEVERGVVVDAWSAATMFRGIERSLVGRDPRDAWLLAERICGSCNGVHGLASVRAVERALKIRIPPNARLVRNLVAGSQLVTSHVTGFYQRHAPDWADLVAGASGDPATASGIARSVAEGPRTDLVYFRRARERLASLVASGDLGTFGRAGAGGAAHRLTSSANLMVAAHALEALDWRRGMTRLHTFFGGKSPHPQTFLVGGLALTPPWGGPARATTGEHPRRPQSEAPAALGERGLAQIADLVTRTRAFVDEVYLPDVLYLADIYRDQAGVGRGIGNYLAAGEFPEDDEDDPALLLPRGRLMDGVLDELDTVDQAGFGEGVATTHDRGSGAEVRHPYDGSTDPHYQGPPPPVTTLQGAARYSWSKAPRYFDDPVEVGPAARLLVAHAVGGDAGRTVARVLENLDLDLDAFSSTLGRTVARAIEAKIVADRLDAWLADLVANLAAGDLAFADISRWDPATWPAEAEGWSLGESGKGTVGHWLRIRDRRVTAYQVVDGSTWNLSPRDSRGRRGALEEALVGTPVPDLANPIEVLRTVHSFDPCPACAVQ